MTTYITTPIYYVNAHPHLGHAYTTIVADTYARFRRLRGGEVRFQTGTDEHGDKIAQAAAAEGIPPKEYVDRINAEFRALLPVIGAEPDHFIRTTDPEHVRTVQAILQRVYDRGDIEFSEYAGLYCKGCERFLTEKELVDGGLCPDHRTPPEEIREANYFFKMSRYQDRLIDHIKANPDFITPERYRNEVLAFLRDDLEDLCISRPTSRLTWGIPLPFDENFVTYVWFDALINYLTGLGWPDDAKFSRFWPVAEHLIAKDILKPHAIFWPTMLWAMGLEPYQRLHVHGYWNVGEMKMSKSIGNVVRPADLVKEYGRDTLRYFVLREMAFGLDASFSSRAIEERHDSDLANDLGNLYSRSLTMLRKYADSRVPESDDAGGSGADQDLRQAIADHVAVHVREMEAFNFHLALRAAWEIVGLLNRYIVNNAPWELVKEEGSEARLRAVLYHLAEGLRIVAVLVSPAMPETGARMLQGLGAADLVRELPLEEAASWGLLPAGTALAGGGHLFERLGGKKKKQQQARQKNKQKKQKQQGGDGAGAAAAGQQDGLISFEEFQRLDLRVAEIVEAEAVPKSNKLVRLTVRCPEERTIVAGIAGHYEPEGLVGRQVIIVANLKPAKLMGIRSEGMVLAAADGDALVLSTVERPVAPGSRVA